jgi:outer membrane beta-barrel protein
MKTKLLTNLLFIALIFNVIQANAADAKKADAKKSDSKKAEAPAPVPPVAPMEKETRTSDKVDLKKLEEKYWSAKDEDYAVIQNRLYSKAGRIYLSGVYGTLVNDQFAKSTTLGGHLGYYFTEDFGLEASYFAYNSKNSDTVNKFNTLAANVSPNYNLPGSSQTLSVTYTPFYAKMAFMNTAILYFDMGFSLGVGQTTYDQMNQGVDNLAIANGTEYKVNKSASHFEFGVMQQLFLSKYFALRLDLKNTFYTEKIVPYKANEAKVETSNSKNNTTLTLGGTFFFP